MPRIQKVTNPDKIVTDNLVLKELKRQHIDKDFVEFSQDYAPRSLGKGHSPYAKFYRDLKSNKRFMVVSGLPVVKPDGTKIEVGWFYKKGKYYSKPNLFSAVVDGTRITVTCLNDQPDSRKEGDFVSWKPRLYLNNIEQTPEAVVLLPIDPINPDLQETTLEWDYGICKRRIRSIQGRLREKWVFESNPKGDVRIEHNHTGNMKLRLGEYAVDGDTEFVSAMVFDEADYPFEIGASPETFNPDANVESTSVDGHVRHWEENQTWAAIRGGAGTESYDLSINLQLLMRCSDTSNRYNELSRVILLFDTEALPDDAIIISATLSIFGNNKSNGMGASPTYNVYAVAPFSEIALQSDDFQDFSSVPFCDTPMTYNLFNNAGWNNWLLNLAGRNATNKTGITKLGIREVVYDVDGAIPPYVSENIAYIQAQAADSASNIPKLVVTYEEVVSAPTVTTQAVTNIQPTEAVGNGNITDTGGENPHTRGVCWNIGGNPTTSDSKSEDNGAGSYGTGAFSKSMTGLTPGQHYYVRAYAINSEGTSYGGEVEFDTNKDVISSDSGGGVDGHQAVAPQSAGESGSGIDAFTSLLGIFTRSDIGLGTDAKLSLAVALIKADTGSGIEAILDRALVLTELGLGSDTTLKDKTSSDDGIGTDAILGFLDRMSAEYGYGVDASKFGDRPLLLFESGLGVESSLLRDLGQPKHSSDVGAGIDASTLASLFTRADSGVATEAITLLAAAMLAGDNGQGVDALIELTETIKDILTADTGQGIDALVEVVVTFKDIFASDAGQGVETVLSYLRTLVDSGEGVENLHLVGIIGRRMRMKVYQKEAFQMKAYTSETGEG